ncbi:MAG: hypothetical protein ABL949_07280 [Fimbriimonadaceae bacterium]
MEQGDEHLDLRGAVGKDFQPFIGQVFDVALDEAGEPFTSFKLVEATPTEARPFRLIFEGPVTVPLDQGTFYFKNASTDTLTIFIVPISADAQTRAYEAIFN